MIHVIARFSPQAWVNNYAIDVDLEGEDEWDATNYFDQLPSPEYKAMLAERMEKDGDALDSSDLFLLDPQAPEWVRNWHGPFDIRLRREED